MDFQNLALLNCDLPGSWVDPGGVMRTRNLGVLGGNVQVGDGVTEGTYPAQRVPHGAWFDGSDDYLRRDEVGSELTFTDPAQFSIELLIARDVVPVGGFAFYACKSGGGAGLSAPYMLLLNNDAGVLKVSWASMSSFGAMRGILAVAVGDLWPAGVLSHVVAAYEGTAWQLYINSVLAHVSVASGCYAPDAAGHPLYVMAGRYGTGAMHSFARGGLYNFSEYPFALSPGEVAQQHRQRLGGTNVVG